MSHDEKNKAVPFVVGPHNIHKLFELLKKLTLKAATEPSDRIRYCCVCNGAMATQPAALELTEQGPKYYCAAHAPPLF